jgi:hypothetical protein
MTPVEQFLFDANRRHFHEINVMAYKPMSPAEQAHSWATCRHCGASLTMAEIAERHCSTCRKDEAVRHG